MPTAPASAALLALLLVSPPAVAAAGPELVPCRLPDGDGGEIEARCGSFEVPEDRTASDGRLVALRVAVVPARGPAASRAPDPIVYFAGGPGESAVDLAPYLAPELAGLLERRDVLLVDARGTGGSGALRCPVNGAEGETGAPSIAAVESALDHFVEPAVARRCRDLLARDHDLSRYTTDAIADDVAEVAAALGYERLNVIGARTEPVPRPSSCAAIPTGCAPSTSRRCCRSGSTSRPTSPRRPRRPSAGSSPTAPPSPPATARSRTRPPTCGRCSPG